MVSIAQNASIGWTYYTTGPVATRDFYTFTVSPGFGNVQITMNDRGVGSYNPDFEISRNGSVLRNTNFVYGNSQTLYFNDLQAGDYTIAVYLQPSSAPPTLRDWQLGSYRYQWRYDVDVYASRSYSPVDNAGNTPSAARAITVGSSSTSYTDWVGSTDTNDYYRFSLANSGNFNLNLTGMTADADVQLLNSSGSLIASSTNGGTASESITGQLSAGTYYIRVYPYSGDTNYNLSVSAVSLAPVNNLSLIGDNTNNVLTGGLGNDTLEGLGGNDTLNGGAGNDTLTGGTESDYFTFNTPTEGIDRITDFSVIDDTIVVSATGFSGGLVAGAAIIPNQLVIGSGATTLNHRFIYNSSTGALFFDADGNGALASTQIATLNPNLALTHQDIYVA
ncbi:MAG: pre-peptidase C-terminal domain-containing protein [Microcystis sp. LE19-114.1B]|jgi:Ca2+-binding RTX toxin-like protein|nr:pre-peptidase C-terminal domain-containing protein [Microcystis sp. LE19-114.1B]